MKIIKNALVASAILLLVGFATYSSFSPSKPLSIVKDINLVDIKAQAGLREQSEYFDGSLYYLSETSEYGMELWRASDGKAEMVEDLNPGVGYIWLDRIIKDETHIYFIIDNYDSKEIYSLAKGESELNKISPDEYFNTYLFKNFDDKTYFVMSRSGSPSEVSTLSNGAIVSVSNNSDYAYAEIYDYSFHNQGLYLSGDFEGEQQILEYKDGNKNVIDSSAGQAKFIASEQALYFRKRVGGDTEFYKFDGNSFNLSGRLGSPYFGDSSYVAYGEYLAFYGYDNSGSSEAQLHVTGGNGFTQVTNFDGSNFTGVNYVAVAEDSLYYYTNSGSPQEIKLYQLKQLNNSLLTFDGDAIDGQLNNEMTFVEGNKVIFWGRKDGEYSVYSVKEGVVTKKFTPNDNFREVPQNYNNALFYMHNRGDGFHEMVKLDLETLTVSVVSQLSTEVASLVDVDEKTFISYGVGHNRRDLGEVSGNIITPYFKNATTGSSDPHGFVESSGLTYFWANDGISGREIWVSNGYEAEFLLEVSLDEDDTRHKLLKLGESVLVFPQTWDGGKIYLINQKKSKEIGEISGIYRDYTKVEEAIFFVAKPVGSYVDTLFMINEEGLTEIASEAFDVIFNVGTGVVFSKSGSSNDLYYSDGSKTIPLKTNGVELSYIESSIGFEGESYYLIATSGETREKSIFLFSEIDGLNALDYDLSKYRAIAGLTSKNDTLLRLTKEDGSGYVYAKLNGDNVEQVDVSSLPGVPHLVSKSKNRLYFEATDNETYTKFYYYYENGEFIKVDWSLEGNHRVVDLGDNTDWLIVHNDSDESHFILSNNGEKIEFVGKVQVDAPLLEAIRASDGVFLRFGQRIENSELAYVVKDGTVSLLSENREFHWGGFDSINELFMGKGHGKWFFMRGCTSGYGCEPYSMNLNQLPSAKFDSESSYYSGQEVTLDASTTIDSDGDILEYNWVQLSGPEIDFDVTEGEAISFKAPGVDSAQDVVIELTVVDDGYDKDITSKSFKVKPNSAPEISIVAPQSAEEGSTVTLDASGTVDNEGEELSFVWSVDTGGVTLSKRTEAVTSFEVPSLSADTIAKLTLTVTDASGYQSAQSIDIQLLNKASEDNANDDSGSDGGSGGGSTGMFLLMLLGLAYLRRVSIK